MVALRWLGRLEASRPAIGTFVYRELRCTHGTRLRDDHLRTRGRILLPSGSDCGDVHQRGRPDLRLQGNGRRHSRPDGHHNRPTDYAVASPNHKYKTFTIADLITGVTDNCDSSVGIGSAVITMATSDEANNSGGDGNTTNDIVIAGDCKSVQLRSERSGSGNGRVYLIIVTVRDGSGNVSTATAKVTVPKSQNGSPAIDDGPHYTVLSGCP